MKMNRMEAYEAGKDRGYSVATWVDTPGIGNPILPETDWVGLGTEVNPENQAEYFELLCDEAESNDRQYSPFEFLAHELNIDEGDADYLWDAFLEGIMEGIAKEANNRF